MWHQKKAARLVICVSLLAFSALLHAASTPTTLADPLYTSSSSLRYYYGSTVTLSPDGSLAVVAANTGGYQIQPNTPASVYVFQYAGGAWSSTPIITLSDPLANPNCGDHDPTDGFAYGVAVSGITNNGFLLAVGSPAGGALFPNCPTSPSNVTYGVVYIYQCSLSSVSCGFPVAVLADPAASPSAGDSFGFALAISQDGSNVLVGAPGSSGSPPPGGGTPGPGILGSAYLFTATGGTWPASPNATLNNAAGACYLTGTAPYQSNQCDQFGYAVALSGTGSNQTALIGAPGAAVSNAGSPQPGAGQAFIFSNGAGSWSLATTFADPTAAPLNDQFGLAVALSADGTKALIGAPNAAAPLAIPGEVGAASLYMQSSGSWQGVSAPAVTFTNPQTPASLPPPPPATSTNPANGGFGTSVGLSSDGTTLIVGLPDALEGSDSQGYGGTGQADVYACNYAVAPISCPVSTTLVDPPALTQVNGVYPSPIDFFAASVAISGDGSVVLAGAPDTGSAAGGAIDSGTAYVYGAPAATAPATLSISLTSAPASVATGGSINYNFTVTDTSASAGAASLTLTDALPSGVTYKSSSGGAGGTCVSSTTGGITTVTCTLATLAAKVAWQPSITVIAGNAGTITDGGSVLASGVAATSSNTVSTVVVAPPIANSGSLTTGENTAQSSTLTASDAGSTLTLSYAIVANPAHGTVTLTPATGAYTYTPGSGYHGPDSFTFDVSNGVATSAPATITITVSASQLTLTYSGPNGVSVTPGEQLTYTATVANIGSVPADNLALSVSVPSGVTLVSYATPVGTCTGGSAVSCTLATLNSAPWVLTVVVSVNAADAAGAAIASSASLSLTNGASPAPVNASVTVAAAPGGGGGGASGGGGIGWLELVGLAGFVWFGRRRRGS